MCQPLWHDIFEPHVLIVFMVRSRKPKLLSWRPCGGVASPCFSECWFRFLAFVCSLLNGLVEDRGESSDEEPPTLSRPPDEWPTLLLAAHNGFAFDFAVLLCECYRHGLNLAVFERWVYVDTLHVVRSVALEAAPCFKLQCMTARVCDPADLKAHRGRDDCVALLGVLQHLAARLGLTVEGLMRMFAEEIDLLNSTAQVFTLVCA